MTRASVDDRVPLHPARVVVSGFAVFIALGTLLLSLPVASSGERVAVFDAVFTATSAVTVTGLVVVDTPTTWSTFGELVILGLIQVGGFGIMTIGSLLLMTLSDMSLRSRMLTGVETSSVALGDVRRVVRWVALVTVAVELVVAVALGLRFAAEDSISLARGAYLGLFHSVSAFNNAGFSLFSDSLVGYATDPLVNLTVLGALVVGGIGFPVLFDLSDRVGRRSRLSLHSRLMLAATAVLLVLGLAATLSLEWSNPGTFGDLAVGEKVLASLFHSGSSRTAGFNTVDIAAMEDSTLLVTDGLMFIGAGSASTGGGIKVTTFALLAFVIWAEVRGDPHTSVFNRRLPPDVQRQALAIALLAVAGVVIGTITLITVSDLDQSDALFEVVSALGTVGLSTGLTPDLHWAARVMVIVLMFVGRVGPLTLGVALAARARRQRYSYPTERVLIG